jgi:hypothetical protein
MALPSSLFLGMILSNHRLSNKCNIVHCIVIGVVIDRAILNKKKYVIYKDIEKNCKECPYKLTAGVWENNPCGYCHWKKDK